MLTKRSSCLPGMMFMLPAAALYVPLDANAESATDIELRVRQELEQRLTSPDKAEVFDLYLRLTWQFGT